MVLFDSTRQLDSVEYLICLGLHYKDLVKFKLQFAMIFQVIAKNFKGNSGKVLKTEETLILIGT